MTQSVPDGDTYHVPCAEIIRVEELGHVFRNGTRALDGVSFSVAEGEFVIVAGRNGSGKTVLMQHLNGLLRPSSGRVFYRGIPVERDLLAVRQRLGLVFQEAESQIVGETVAADIAFGPENLKLSHEEIRNRVTEALVACGLSGLADARPSELSGGERRRLAIAGVLAMHAETIILDEPFANLDFPSVVMVLRELVALKASGKTIMVLTHEIEKVAAHASRIIIMNEGRIVRDARPEEALASGLEAYGLRNPLKPRLSIEDLTWLG
jgi:biotin transport system ATP-binding protein